MVGKFRNWWQRPKQQASSDSSKVRRLWGKEFPLVNYGLAEDQVVAFVDDLIARYQAVLQNQESVSPLRIFSKQVVDEAEREAAAIRTKTKREAEVEAARIIAEAKERAQVMVSQSKQRAEEMTEKEVRNILLTANKEAELIETQAIQLAQRFFIQAREDIQGQIAAEVKQAYYHLLGTLQELLTESQSIEAEWRSKTQELWRAPIPKLEDFHPSLPHSFPAMETPLPIVAEESSPALILSGLSPQETRSELKRNPFGEVAPVPEEESHSGKSPRGEASEEMDAPARDELAPAEGPRVPKPPEEETPSNLYSGEVALVLPSPLDVRRVTTLYKHLQNIPGLKTFRTSGSWDEGIVLSVVLDEPLPLLSMLQAIAMVEATPYSKEGGGRLKTIRGPLEKGGKPMERVVITFKDQEDPEGKEETVTGEV
ncbi:MAG: hypothetical protein HYU30_09330 [Chloroflexi bacterium]|nr:hypothetical protein [Chloroflexota bacterium]